MISKISQTEKDKNHMISFIGGIKQKVTNVLTKQTTINSQMQTTECLPEETGQREGKMDKGAKYMLREGN